MNATAINYLKESIGCECRRIFRNNLKYARVRRRQNLSLIRLARHCLPKKKKKKKKKKNILNKNTDQNSSTICPRENCRKIEKALRNYGFILTDKDYTVTVVLPLCNLNIHTFLCVTCFTFLYFFVYQCAKHSDNIQSAPKPRFCIFLLLCQRSNDSNI